MPPSWHPVPACAARLRCRRAVLRCGNGLTQAELFYLRQRKLESNADRCCGVARCHSGGFLLRIMPPSWHPVPACAPRLRCRRAVLLAGTIALHRFSISSPDLRIDAAIRSKQGQSVHRFLISSPDFRIDVAPGLILGISLQFKGRSIVPRPGNAGWAGTSDGVAARGFVNGEGPAAQRWEGKHRRCAPVRSPCPQAESDAGALSRS